MLCSNSAQNIFLFLFRKSFLFRSVLFNFQMFGDFPDNILLLISHLIPYVQRTYLHDISSLMVLMFVLWSQIMVCVGE